MLEKPITQEQPLTEEKRKEKAAEIKTMLTELAHLYTKTETLMAVQEETYTAAVRAQADFLRENAPELEEQIQASREALSERKSELAKAEASLKEMAKEYHLLTAETSPFEGGGLLVKKFEDSEGHLEVEDKEAIKWAIKNKYPALLQLNRKSYQEQLQLGTIEDMPGRIKFDKTDWKPYVYKNKLIAEFPVLPEAEVGAPEETLQDPPEGPESLF